MMTDTAPKTFYEFQDRVKAERAKLDAGKITQATLAAYIDEQRRELNRYERKHYPTLTPDQNRVLLAKVRGALQAAITAGDEDRIAAATDGYAYAAYYLWNTHPGEIKDRVAARSIDLSDPFTSLKEILADARESLAIQKKEYAANPAPYNRTYLDGAQHDADVAQADLDKAEAVTLPAIVESDLSGIEGAA